MRAPFTELYLHCVWATWDRLPLITTGAEPGLYRAIHAKCDELKCPCLAIGGMPDHIHVLVRLHATVSVADLLKEVKGTSSHLITHVTQPGEFFKWQGGYGAFTVGKADAPAVTAYVEHQKQHHAEHELWDDWEQTLIESDAGGLGG
jgi:REP element-mobilizing transposase RayT